MLNVGAFGFVLLLSVAEAECFNRLSLSFIKLVQPLLSDKLTNQPSKLHCCSHTVYVHCAVLQLTHSVDIFPCSEVCSD